MRLFNPFTPSEIVTDPNEFFGREQELATVERTFERSSVAIQGIVGIGKSSLGYQARLRLEGFERVGKSEFVAATCHADIVDIDDLASAVVRQLVEVDEGSNKVSGRISLFSTLSFGKDAATITRNFVEGKHFEILGRVLSKEYVKDYSQGYGYLVIWFDEVDKCVEPVARFVRALLNKTQADGMPHVRFLLTGVRPFFSRLLAVDEGLIRFFPNAIELSPLSFDETVDLLQTKLTEVVKDAEAKGREISIHPGVIARIAELSNGNPSLVQELGYSLIESENSGEDGTIDLKDMYHGLEDICLNRRRIHYDALIDMLESSELVKPFVALYQEMKKSVPGQIASGRAARIIQVSEIDRLVDLNILRRGTGSYYFADELFRVRIAFDQMAEFGSKEEFVRELQRFTDPDFEELYKDESDDLEGYE